MYRDRLAEIEESWKFTRESARQNLMRAITEEGMSVATAAKLSGCDRRVVTTWLKVWNVEHKNPGHGN